MKNLHEISMAMPHDLLSNYHRLSCKALFARYFDGIRSLHPEIYSARVDPSHYWNVQYGLRDALFKRVQIQHVGSTIPLLIYEYYANRFSDAPCDTLLGLTCLRTRIFVGQRSFKYGFEISVLMVISNSLINISCVQKQHRCLVRPKRPCTRTESFLRRPCLLIAAQQYLLDLAHAILLGVPR